MSPTRWPSGRRSIPPLEEIQADLDEPLQEYNFHRTNQGKYCKGRTPMETFKDGVDLCKQYLHNREEVIKEVV